MRALPIHSFKHFCCWMDRLATLHSATDTQTDRHMPKADPTVCSTIGQKAIIFRHQHQQILTNKINNNKIDDDDDEGDDDNNNNKKISCC